MQCPSCKKSALVPTKFAEGLPSFTCPSCEGHLIEILSYRFWSERASATARDSVNLVASEPTDSKHALVCPQCQKVMTKFSLSGSATNKIDLCGNCGRFWIDRGEWALVRSLNLDTSLTQIFNEPWQKATRQAQVSLAKSHRLRETLSDEEYQRLVDLREWINGHPAKATILDFLRLS